MSNRTRTTARRAAPALASVAALGALAVLPTAGDAAPRHVPGTGNGAQITTNGPDLRSAAIVDNQNVQFCFDQVVNGALAGTGFYVQTYDASRYFRSTSAAISISNPNCVRAQFPANADLGQGTIGSIAGGAVTIAGGLSSLPSSEPLGGSGATPRAGDTTAPDLQGVDVNRDAKTITYKFDEQLTNLGAAASFYFNDAEGFTREATAVSVNGTAVTATFAQDVGTAERAGVRAGAVSDRPATGTYIAGRPLATPAGAAAVGIGQTGLTTLQSATPSSSSKIWTLKYDVSVDGGAVGRIVAVLDDGTSVAAVGETPLSDATTIRVTFPDSLDQAAGHVVRIVDLGGGAVTRDAAGINSGASAANVGTPDNRPGKTNGPDLLKASYDGAANTVVYTYDAPVSSDTASGAFTTASAGTAQGSAGTSTRSGNDVIVDFPATARTSIGAGVDEGTVRDALGNPSPFSVVSYTTEAAPPSQTPPGQTPPGTTPPGTPPPGTTTPPATTTPAKPRAATRVTIRRSGSRITGTVKSSGRGCQVGRTVSLKRIGRVKALKKTHTNSKGVYRFKRSASTRGKKVRVVVGARTGTYAICGAKTSKTIRG